MIVRLSPAEIREILKKHIVSMGFTEVNEFVGFGNIDAVEYKVGPPKPALPHPLYPPGVRGGITLGDENTST